MEKTILISGCAVVTSDANSRMMFEFLPDDPKGQQLEGCRMGGNAQLMRSGTFYFIPFKKRVRNNALLMRKAAHGRLSGTRDGAIQLTLKSFATENIDWQRAFLVETVQMLTDMMGSERMTGYLNELITNINKQAR